MKKSLLGLFLFFLFQSRLLAVTPDAYCQAGNQLYGQKKYAQAGSYYQAALQMDPALYGALVGMGNCDYAQGNIPQALGYYQRALDLHPENTGLRQFVQGIQAKNPSASKAASENPQGVVDPAAQGLALYQKGQYAAAISYFQEALLKNPNDAASNFYLGYCYQVTGYPRDAALAYALSYQAYPNAQVKPYVDRSRAGLSEEDRQWVDMHLTPQFAAATATQSPFRQTFGLRWGTTLQWVGLKDFDDCAKSLLDIAQKEQLTDPSTQFSAAVPNAAIDLEVNPFFRLQPDLELGVTLDYLLLPNFDAQTVSDSLGTQEESIGFQVLEGGVSARYRFLNLPKSKISFFAEANPFVYSVSLHYSDTMSDSNPDLVVGDFTNIGFGGRAKVGADWEPLQDFKIAVYGGFQYAAPSGFHGTSTDSNYQTSPGQLEIEDDNNGHRLISLVNDGTNTQGRFLAPLTADLSGFLGGLDLSILF